MSLRRFGLTAALGAMMAMLGCAQGLPGPGPSSSAGERLADQATESDETPQRRRARLRFELAAGYLQEGQPQVALDEAKQAIAIDPRYADAFTLRGLAYLRLNNPALASDSFERALLLDPRNPDAAHNLGLLRCKQGRFAEAEKHFTQALTSLNYAQQPRNWVAQGLCQVNAGHAGPAEASFLRALSLDAGDATAAYQLARLLQQRGDPTAARPHVLKLNSSASASAMSLWLGIRVERALGNLEAMRALGEQLRARFGQSRELNAYDKGAFHE